jgi:hypothetical protein
VFKKSAHLQYYLTRLNLSKLDNMNITDGNGIKKNLRNGYHGLGGRL